MKRRPGGFSLTELLVATTLLVTATTGGIAALARAQSARSDAGALQQLHERSQYVFATLEPELQMAGFFGTDLDPPRLDASDIPEPARRCGEMLVSRLDQPLQVIAPTQLACALRGGGAAGSGQLLIVRRLAAHTATRPESGRAQWFTPGLSTEPGRLYWSGEAPWNPSAPVAGTELRELIVRVYYVARAADGDAATPALRVKSLTSIAGTPAFVDTEVMHGIDDLQVELLPSPTAPRSARVHLRVRSDSTATRHGREPRTLQVTRHFALRNVHD